MKKSKSKVVRTILWIKNAILVLILLGLVFIVVITMIARFSGETPSLFGYSLYRVSSGSMEPELQVGDVILTGGCSPESIEVGDIVTYTSNKGKTLGKTITHRVVRALYKESGKEYIVTKGDSNPDNDAPVDVTNIKGKCICKIEILNTLYSFFISPLGLLSLIALIILAFFNEIIIFAKAILGIGYEDEKKDSVEEIIERYKKGDSGKTAPEKADESKDDEAL